MSGKKIRDYCFPELPLLSIQNSSDSRKRQILSRLNRLQATGWQCYLRLTSSSSVATRDSLSKLSLSSRCSFVSVARHSPNNWLLLPPSHLDNIQASLILLSVCRRFVLCARLTKRSTTISLFSILIFKDVGRHPKSGKKKGGIKAHTKTHANEGVPSAIRFTVAYELLCAETCRLL